MIGGIITQYYHPRIGFLVYSVMGLAVSFNGLFLTMASEEEDNEHEHTETESSASLMDT